MGTPMTATAVAVLAWLPPATPAIAQEPSDSLLPFCRDGWNEAPCRLRPFPPPGWIPCQAGEHGCDTIYSRDRVGPADPPEGWREATVTEVLEALERERESGTDWRSVPKLLAAAILRQGSRPRPAAELDAFADRLAAMMADATLPEHVRDNARGALASAADPDSFPRGIPYARGFDLLVQAYEGGVDDWLLHTIFWVDPERGPAYVRDVLERSERPPMCRWRYDRDAGWLPTTRWDTPLPGCDGHGDNHVYWRDASETTWCEAGGLLYGDVMNEAIDREWGGGVTMHSEEPTPVPDGLPEHVDDWYRRCN